MKLGDLLGRLAKGGGTVKRLPHTFAFDFVQHTELRVSLTVGLSAMTRRLPTAAGRGGYGTGAKVTEREELLEKVVSGGLKIGQRL